MKRVLKERDRLLRRLAGIAGGTGAIATAACAFAPGGMPQLAALVCVVLSMGQAVLLTRFAMRGAGAEPVLTVIASAALILAVGFAGPHRTPDAATAIVVSGGLTAASVALPLVVRRGVAPVAWLAAAVLAAAAAPVFAGRPVTGVVVAIAAGWAAFALAGALLEAAGRRAADRAAEIGRAHRAERQASEREAQFRQDARVLHDTVLATLSLLAHSGVGVRADTLRQQADEDARLLRQLRLGAPLGQPSAALFSPEAEAGDILGQTFELVRQRFGRMGLDVSWHGARRLVLPRETLDALVGALGECLENVRRHSGASRADVTISDDDRTVRAMVTDEGVGFDSAGVAAERLGFAESVVGRLEHVGGRARVFSSPGSGTTVMLEVPKP
ncbi:sensor histidine kinase [Agromyces archimandritae]|uniref:Histidine kinase n=1 Tax=Agromyces archimandritae TaxID=2781962 RepID=A0A975FN63_9MICO|nr:ATP-binding protein [Agromyces archimandritae]QTX05199.1 histidine kinase [Agromyces archimandritae]